MADLGAKRRLDSVSLYLEDLGSPACEPITREEEAELGARALDGDQDARDALVCANLRYVVSVAKRFRGAPLPYADLIAEANFGMVRAIRTYDPTRGTRFISYADMYIRQAIRTALDKYRLAVSISKDRGALVKPMERYRRAYVRRFEREPTVGEIADALDCSQSDVRAVLPIVRSIEQSLDDPAPVERDRPLADVVSDPAAVPEREAHDRVLSSRIREALDELSEDERFVTRFYYGLDGAKPRTLAEVGAVLGVSRQRVHQIKNNALDRLREIAAMRLYAEDRPSG